VIPGAFFWQGRPNFGDLLTPLLLAHFANTEVMWAPAADADLVCVGSILEALPPGWDGIVAGAGKLKESSNINLTMATVLGVRGPLTAGSVKGIGKDYVLGDPGLLANELAHVDKEHDLGLVPHWSDGELETRPEFLKYNPRIIRPSTDPIEVIQEIGRCRKIVASSLHGIIVADAFGIPRRVEMAKIFEREGGSWKFRDHDGAVGVKFQVGVTQEAPRYIVDDRQSELFDMLKSVGRRLLGAKQ
jgi:pyruvyltransferase